MPERARGATSGRLAGWLTLVAALIALAYASTYAAGAEGNGPSDFFYRWDTFVGTLVQETLIVGLVLWIVYGGPARALLGLRRPWSWPKALGLMLLILVLVWILGVVLDPYLHPGEEQGLVPEQWRPQEAAPFAANVWATTLVVPAAEELTFRGAGYSLLAARYGKGVAIVGTGILFGAAHGLVLALPLLVAFGLGLAWLRSRTGSVVPGILLHGLFNALAVLVGVLT
jgi:membrane protease YdiL (CAAX protease family)